MAYVIKTPMGQFDSLRHAQEDTRLSREEIFVLCRTPNSGWSQKRKGGTRMVDPFIQQERARRQQIRAQWLGTAPAVTQPAPQVAQQATVDLTPVLTELQELRTMIAELRAEVLELNDQALNLMTLPAGTQLNLPGVAWT